MQKWKFLILLVGILLLVVAGVWKFSLSQRWAQRVPDDWKWEANVLGTNLYPDEQGNFPENRIFPDGDDLNLTERVVSAGEANDNSITVTDHSIARDINTNAVIWDYAYTAEVDPETGQHTTPEFQDDYFIFPRHVEKKTYHIRHSSYQGLPVEFKGEETLDGMKTYHFAFTGDIDNSAAYGDQPLEENQDIHCQGLYLEYWVEPLTGEVIKYREGCPGDYVYDTTTGENLLALSRWSAESTGDDIIRRVNTISSQRNTLLLTSTYIPLALVLGGVLLLALGLYAFVSKPSVVSA